MATEHDLVVIGAGPGGYVAAIRGAQLGLNVAIVDREELLGGTCLRIGCIPSKVLLESTELYAEARDSFQEHGISVGEVQMDLPALMRRKEETVTGLARGVAGLLKKHGVTTHRGTGRLTGEGRVLVEAEEAHELRTRHVLIATGSHSAPLPGVELDGERIGTSTEALGYPEVPEHLVVIGAGAIGLELGSVWARLGSQVTVLEYLDRILPGMEADIARQARKLLARQGLEFHLGARVTGARREGEGAVVEAEGMDPIRCDRVLLAVGRQPHTEGLGLEDLQVDVDGRGAILVDQHYQTSRPGVYAIGDVIPGPMLAHKAEEEGIACVEHLATGYGHVNYQAIPSIVYTQPEVAAVGRTTEELREEGIEHKVGTFPFQANGRARALGHTRGQVKVLADADTDRLLGVHIVGPRAGDLIAEAAVAIEFGASAEDLARACHAHPTLAETLKEAALASQGRAIHA